jgi:putative ABC transport system substrate-binding protein
MRCHRLRRREFISLLGGAAAWPLAARAQQAGGMRRIGVLVGSGTDADDLDMQARFVAFAQALQQLGWIDGRNVQIEYRYASGDPESIRRYAAELASWMSANALLIAGRDWVKDLR